MNLSGQVGLSTRSRTRATFDLTAGSLPANVTCPSTTLRDYTYTWNINDCSLHVILITTTNQLKSQREKKTKRTTKFDDKTHARTHARLQKFVPIDFNYSPVPRLFNYWKYRTNILSEFLIYVSLVSCLSFMHSSLYTLSIAKSCKFLFYTFYEYYI